MATVTPVEWVHKDGSVGRRFKLTYVDAQGKRRRKNFKTRRAADKARVQTEAQLAAGTHIHDSESLSVIETAQEWLDHMEALVKAGKREECTWDKYDSHIRNHVSPSSFARLKLSQLRTPDCQAFVDELSLRLSHEMTIKVRSTLKTAFGFAARRGWIVGNPMRDTEIVHVERKDDRVVIPEKAEVTAIIEAAERQAPADKGRALALVMTGFLCGPRPSELLGLETEAATLDSDTPEIRISQRIDKRAKLGQPKRKASHRSIPIGPRLATVLRAWITKGICNIKVLEVASKEGVIRKLRMLFPTEIGTPISYYNFYNRIWSPLLIAAKVTIEIPPQKKGDRATAVSKYPPNVMRHFAASLWIEQDITPKRLQQRMGHASIKTTMDTYGHLWRNVAAEQQEAAKAEGALL